MFICSYNMFQYDQYNFYNIQILIKFVFKKLVVLKWFKFKFYNMYIV